MIGQGMTEEGLHHNGAVSQFWCADLDLNSAQFECGTIGGQSTKIRINMYRVSRRYYLRSLTECLTKDQFLSDVFDVSLLL